MPFASFLLSTVWPEIPLFLSPSSSVGFFLHFFVAISLPSIPLWAGLFSEELGEVDFGEFMPSCKFNQLELSTSDFHCPRIASTILQEERFQQRGHLTQTFGLHLPSPFYLSLSVSGFACDESLLSLFSPNLWGLWHLSWLGGGKGVCCVVGFFQLRVVQLGRLCASFCWREYACASSTGSRKILPCC